MVEKPFSTGPWTHQYCTSQSWMPKSGELSSSVNEIQMNQQIHGQAIPTQVVLQYMPSESESFEVIYLTILSIS